jgi:hypothetical protein
MPAIVSVGPRDVDDSADSHVGVALSCIGLEPERAWFGKKSLHKGRSIDAPQAMRRWAAIALTLLLGLILSGGSLGFLQVVAWAGMIVSRAHSEPVAEAILTTVDGKHPCAICRFLQGNHLPDPLIVPNKLELTKQAIVDGDHGAWYVGCAGVVSVLPLYDRRIVLDGVSEQPPLPPPRT